MCKRTLLFQSMYQPLNLLDAGMTSLEVVSAEISRSTEMWLFIITIIIKRRVSMSVARS